jgi:hypothetical protein
MSRWRAQLTERNFGDPMRRSERAPLVASSVVLPHVFCIACGAGGLMARAGVA